MTAAHGAPGGRETAGVLGEAATVSSADLTITLNFESNLEVN